MIVSPFQLQPNRPQIRRGFSLPSDTVDVFLPQSGQLIVSFISIQWGAIGIRVSFQSPTGLTATARFMYDKICPGICQKLYTSPQSPHLHLSNPDTWVLSFIQPQFGQRVGLVIPIIRSLTPQLSFLCQLYEQLDSCHGQ